jgi:hypothetical protein
MLYMFQAVSPPIIRSSKFTHSIWYISSLLVATASGSSKLDIYQMLCLHFELLMMGGETA